MSELIKNRLLIYAFYFNFKSVDKGLEYISQLNLNKK